MANKLFGTADSTLVAAAFKHGASNIPMDLKGVYKQREQNVKDFATGINEMFDKIYADNKATNDLLTDVSTKSLNLMESGGVVNEYALTAHNGIINDYKDKLKSITSDYGMGKGGDLERSKLRSEMNTYLANIEKNGALLTEMTKNSANGVLLSDIGDNKNELLTMIISDQNNGTSKTKPEYINGDIYYSLPGTDKKMTMQELAEGFSVENPKLLSKVNTILINFGASASSGKPLTADGLLGLKNSIKSNIATVSEIRNIGQAKLGNMDYSFEEVLTARAKDSSGNIDTSVLKTVYNELEKLGGADLDDDGDIDETDKSLLTQARKEGKVYTDSKNGYTLIDAVKKNKELYRDLMAGYIAETAGKDFYTQGTPSNPNGNLFNLDPKVYFGSYIDDAGQSRGIYNYDVINTINSLKNVIQKGSGTFRGYDDKMYIVKNGRFIIQKGDNKGKEANLNTILNSLKINNLPGIYDYLAKKQKPGYDYNNDGIVDPAPIEPLFNLDFSSPKTEQETKQETKQGGFNFNATRDFT